MACNRAQNIRIKPHDAYFEAKEAFCLDFEDKTGADVGGTSFTFFLANGDCINYGWENGSVGVSQVEEFNFEGLGGSAYDVVGSADHLILADNLDYFWINVTDGANAQSDPALGGLTGWQVDVLSADADTVVRQKVQDAIDSAGLGYVQSTQATFTNFRIEVTYTPGARSPNGTIGQGGMTFQVLTNGSNTTPAPSVPGCIDTTISTLAGNETASFMATGLKNAMDADFPGEYNVTVDGTAVIFEKVDFQVMGGQAEQQSFPGAFSVLAVGGQVYLGLLDADITITPEISNFDVTAHQTGQTILSQIPQNLGATVELTIKECTESIYKAMVTAAGGTYTPGGGTELYGWGTDKLSTNILTYAKRLRLTAVGATDNSEDWIFWKTFPELGGITISGENPQLLPVTFRAFPDDTKPKEIDIYAIGDWTQL